MSLMLIGLTRPGTAAQVVAKDGTIAGMAVRSIEANGLAVLVVPVPQKSRSLFSRRKKGEFPKSVQRVMVTVAAVGPLLPAHPGTIIETDAEALALIVGNAGPLASALGEMGLARQFHVTLFWDRDAVLSRLKSRPALRAAAAIAANGRISLEKATQDLVGIERHRLAGCAAELLRSVSRDMIDLPPDGESCIANHLVLVDAGAEAGFDMALQLIDDEMPGRSVTRSIGPLPAFSFAAIAVDRIEPERLVAARALLGVGPHCGVSEIRNAYLAFAQARLPDLVEGEIAPAAGEAAMAYWLLARHAQLGARLGHEPSVLLDIRRGGQPLALAA